MVEYTCNKYIDDIYGRIERVRVDRRLRLMPYAQAGVITEEDGTVKLISYATCVASVDSEGWLTCGGTYSASTRRHLNRWMREFDTPCDYYTCKEAAEKDLAINIYTGEVLDMPEYIEMLRSREAARKTA